MAKHDKNGNGSNGNGKAPKVPAIPEEIKALLAAMTANAQRPPEKSNVVTTGDARSEVLVSCNDAIRVLAETVAHVATIANTAPHYGIELQEQRGL